ncbi:MAG: L-aspartate oxidase [Elusimicrobia bacterium]|jgi:L-aspartate oxidase|nr:L-aspartate oxidase [Elusimicrobiota bacterium]
MVNENIIKSDVLVIGTGAAGLSFALYADSDIKINMVSKAGPAESSTDRAQGGIAGVTSSGDTFKSHIKDTLTAGAGLCDKKTVKQVVKAAPERINDLRNWGVDFTGGKDNPDLGKEGGHSVRRILHHGDNTGHEIEDNLLKETLKKENVRLYSEHTAIDIILKDGRAVGAYIIDNRTLKVKTFLAGAVIMATGGCGKVYQYTSNPDVATGDGVAMAYRAGAQISNMEFIQFHPTCLYSVKETGFLITEAMRGEGAVLLNPAREKGRENGGETGGENFMSNYDSRKELAPRDIVARAIDSEMKKTGLKHLYLDIASYRKPEFIKQRFPMIYAKLKSLGIDITADKIPVVPAAHYSCGGIKVDRRGNTSIKGLIAIGECSCTGLHGANRLASNSLLEAVVYGKIIAAGIKKVIKDMSAERVSLKISSGISSGISPWKYTGKKLPEHQVFIEQNWMEIRRLMWNYMGIVRSNRRMKEALKRINIIEKEVNHYYWNYLINNSLIEMRNLVETAKIIIKSALMRKESRGLHYNQDYPKKSEKYRKDTVI